MCFFRFVLFSYFCAVFQCDQLVRLYNLFSLLFMRSVCLRYAHIKKSRKKCQLHSPHSHYQVCAFNYSVERIDIFLRLIEFGHRLFHIILISFTICCYTFFSIIHLFFVLFAKQKSLLLLLHSYFVKFSSVFPNWFGF